MSDQEYKPQINEKEILGAPKESKINRIIREMLVSGKPLNQDTVYRELAAKLTLSEIRDKVTDDLGEMASEVLSRVQTSLGTEGIRLLVEPAILTRNEELVAYVQEQGVVIRNQADIEAAREGFKKYLGTKKVYRTLILNEDQLKQVAKDGFVASYIRQMGGVAKIAELQTGYDSVGYNITDLRGRVHAHAHGDQNSFSTLISLSEYPEMSQYGCVAATADKVADPQSKGYMAFTFPVEIDELATIRYGKYLPRKFTSEKNWVYNDTKISYEDTGVELFTEFTVESTKINWDETSITALDQLPIFHLE